MHVVWITGVSGSGKSTVCADLKARGVAAIDADWDGFNEWVDRATGDPVINAPYPTPPDWLASHDWHIRPDRVRELRETGSGVAFLFGAVGNEAEVWDYFDRVGCLVVDDATVVRRLATRTNNAFGKHPEDVERVLSWNATHKSTYEELGAAIIDGSRPLDEVVSAVLDVARGLDGYLDSA